MRTLGRRDFLKLTGAAAAFSAVPRLVSAALAPPRVVVVGGGFGGATVAKYLRLWGGNVDVTLVDPARSHVACILSNGVVTGEYGLSRITIPYSDLAAKHGVRVMRARALEIDPAGRTVAVQANAVTTTLPYDHLVLAPGVSFLKPRGAYDANLTPHAWQAGAQTTLLRDQLAAMPAGGVFVLRIPPSPYRCPPGPYERACVVADYLKRNKPRAKIVVLDANSAIQAEPVNFGAAFSQLYAGVLEYHTSVSIQSLDSATRTLQTSLGPITGSVVNFIPDHRAGKLVLQAGLATDASRRWAPVDPLSYATPAQPAIHVIGDSQATGQPKSGHMANAQAKVCADAILRSFAGLPPDPQPATNSACYSPVSSTLAAWLTASFQYDPTSRAMARVPESFGEAPRWSSDNLEQMFEWADTLFADSFR
jgi:NADH dehydrogenase FAD-containing subunit